MLKQFCLLHIYTASQMCDGLLNAIISLEREGALVYQRMCVPGRCLWSVDPAVDILLGHPHQKRRYVRPRTPLFVRADAADLLEAMAAAAFILHFQPPHRSALGSRPGHARRRDDVVPEAEPADEKLDDPALRKVVGQVVQLENPEVVEGANIRPA